MCLGANRTIRAVCRDGCGTMVPYPRGKRKMETTQAAVPYTYS